MNTYLKRTATDESIQTLTVDKFCEYFIYLYRYNNVN